MFCKNCGNKIEEGTLFCSKCGVKVESESNIVNGTLENNFNNNVNNTSNGNLNNNISSDLANNQNNISNQINESPNTNNNLINNQNTVNNIGNNQNSNMTSINTKKNNTLFIIIVIVASIVVLTLISFIIVKMLSSHNNDYQTSTSNNNNNVTEINNDNKNNNNYEITLGNYKFKLPTDLLYKNGSDYILATNNDKTFIFEMSVYNFAYSDLVNGYQEVVNEVQNSGITVTDVNEVSNGSTNIFLFDLNDGENAYQVYYTELDNNTTIGGALQVYNANLFNTAFSYIEKIKNSKEKVGSFGKDTKEEINIKNYKIREDSFVLKKD